MSSQPIDLLAFTADDRFGVAYKPRWNAVTGSMAASVLLQQLVFRWAHAGRRPFYKFARPCTHRLYRAGDSWEEELGMKRREFENAREAIAVRTRGDVAADALVSYWVDAQRVTWYALNEAVFLQRFAAIYPKSDTGVQLPLSPADSAPPTDLMDETYIAPNGRNVHQPTDELMDETSIGYDVPNVHQRMHETSNRTNGRFVHSLYSQSEIIQQKEPQTTAAPPPAEPPQPVAAAADPLQPILDWIGFDDTLTPKERQTLTVADLLACAYWVHRKRAEAGSRIYNPVGLMRSQWRNGKRPTADFLRLARGWLSCGDDTRRALLDRLEWASDYGDPDFERDFPDIPPVLAAAVYTATNGALGPPSLMPPPAPPPDPREPRPPVGPARVDPPRTAPQPTESTLWRDALAELEMQMTRATFAAWFQGTTATLDGDALTVHVRNHHAVDWLENRLHDLITRTVGSVAGRPLSVRYAIPQEAPA